MLRKIHDAELHFSHLIIYEEIPDIDVALFDCDIVSSSYLHPCGVLDLFQPKTSTFSTRALIWVHFKTVHYFYRPIFSLFSYLKHV